MRDALDHAHMEILSAEECFELLASVPVGRVAVLASGAPRIFPVTFTVSRERIVFRSAVGSKLDSAEMTRAVSFEADEWDPETRSGWSVLASGRATAVTDPERLEELEDVGLEPWLEGTEMEWIELRIEDLSGRRLPAQG